MTSSCIFGVVVRSSIASERPSPSGTTTSRSATSGRRLATTSRACAAVPAESVSNPARAQHRLEPSQQRRVVVEQQHHRLLAPRRYRRRRLVERGDAQRLTLGRVDDHARARRNLRRRHQRRERLRQQPMNRPLQFARAVLDAHAAAREHRPGRRGDLDLERSIAEARVHVPLQFLDVMIEDAAQSRRRRAAGR